VNSRTTWLTTLNQDGSPHVTPVGALWLNGAFWFQTGNGTRKAHNVGRDPRCSVATSVSGADIVVEGAAARVTEAAAVARCAKAWADQGWPAELDESGQGITAQFNAPSQGPPPWFVYRDRGQGDELSAHREMILSVDKRLSTRTAHSHAAGRLAVPG
jgi:Pyridoxamine 5'-phosphate oxidase